MIGLDFKMGNRVSDPKEESKGGWISEADERAPITPPSLFLRRSAGLRGFEWWLAENGEFSGESTN
jgi:hypothetical protein